MVPALGSVADHLPAPVAVSVDLDELYPLLSAIGDSLAESGVIGIVPAPKHLDGPRACA